MEGPCLPEGSGGEEPPEEPYQLALPWKDENGRSDVYEERMYAFERLFDFSKGKRKKRRRFHEYTEKNCEEACGEGGGASPPNRMG